MNEPGILTPEQESILTKYIRERRYGFMTRMIFDLVFVVFTSPLAIVDCMQMLGGFSRRSAELVGNGIAMLAISLRYRRHHYPDGTFFFIWLIILIAGVVMFFRGIGIKFGIGSDLDCMKKGNYFCECKDFGGKSPDTQKHPYYLLDEQQNSYFCPLFLDWKNAEPGSRLLCVTLSNGRKYALLDKTQEKEWWEKEPY